MEDASERPPSGKRSLLEMDTLPSDEAPLAKRLCQESANASPTHLSLLEELCDLEGEDEDPCLDPCVPNSLEQEGLVAEMMKSLEKVIEGDDCRSYGEPSTSVSTDVDAGAFVANHPLTDLSWVASGSATLPESRDDANDLTENDERIRLLLHASDDELGIPSPNSPDLAEPLSLFDEWSSLVEGAADFSVFSSISWFDAPHAHLEDSREIFDPIVLF